MMNLLGLIAGIFEPAAKLVDEMHTSEEEKMNAKAKMFALQASLFSKVQEYESELLKAKTTIIAAEANSQSWLARNWRPMTMIAFVVAVMGYWFGLTPEGLPPESVESMFTLVQIGLGGYVVGRSVEKTAGSVAAIMKSNNNNDS